jgi:hypothetical protein
MEEFRMPQKLADWIYDVRNVEVARGDFVKHGSEQEEVFAINQGNFHIGAPRERSVEPHRRVETRKAASQNENP